MIDLTQKKCVPCEGGIDPLTEGQIRQYKSQINSGWQVLDNKKIERKFAFKNFKQALEFVSKVGEIAEAEGHHPEIQFGWGHAAVTLWTHAIGGLHENDFILAAKIDRISNSKS